MMLLLMLKRWHEFKVMITWAKKKCDTVRLNRHTYTHMSFKLNKRKKCHFFLFTICLHLVRFQCRLYIRFIFLTRFFVCPDFFFTQKSYIKISNVSFPVLFISFSFVSANWDNHRQLLKHKSEHQIQCKLTNHIIYIIATRDIHNVNTLNCCICDCDRYFFFGRDFRREFVNNMRNRYGLRQRRNLWSNLPWVKKRAQRYVTIR